MENNIEGQERLPLETKTITGKEFIDLVYNDDSLPQDKRFYSSQYGGVFKYLDLSESHNNSENKFYSLISLADMIVGLAELEKNPRAENVYWIKFLSVDPKYQGQGFASRLADEIFRFAKAQKISLEEGYQKLKRKFNEFAQKYGVDFKDIEKII